VAEVDNKEKGGVGGINEAMVERQEIGSPETKEQKEGGKIDIEAEDLHSHGHSS
jgi:hypothetical protein